MENLKELFLKKKEINQNIEKAVKNRLSIMGSRIKVMRKQNEFTQEQLADMVNLSRTQITNIESGKSGTTLETVILLSECFMSHPSYLLGFND